MRVGIIAALPGELKYMVHNVPRMPVVRNSGVEMWQWRVNQDTFVAVCGGMGEAAVRRAFSAAESGGSLEAVINLGWAGALTAVAIPGELYIVGEAIDAQTGERFDFLESEARLVTTVRVADPAEKRRLSATYGATIVDMEATVVARLAQMRGIPMYCFKAVSDGFGEDLPDLNLFINANGKLTMPAFLAHIIIRPGYWPALLRLGRNSKEAANKLADVVCLFLHHREFDRS